MNAASHAFVPNNDILGIIMGFPTTLSMNLVRIMLIVHYANLADACHRVC